MNYTMAQAEDTRTRRCQSGKQRFPHPDAALASCSPQHYPYKCARCYGWHIYSTGNTPDVCLFEQKRTYLSWDAAYEMCWDGMSPYLCSHYRHWHIGHAVPRRVRQSQKLVVDGQQRAC